MSYLRLRRFKHRMRYVKSNDGKRRVCCFCSPHLRGLLNNRTIGGRKKRQPPRRGGAKIAQLGAEKRQNRTIGGRKKRQPPAGGGQNRATECRKTIKPHDRGAEKTTAPPQGVAKIAQLGAEKRQNRTIGVRLKKKNGAERDRTDDL